MEGGTWPPDVRSTQPMLPWAEILAAAMGGAVLGAILLSLLPFLFFAMFFPDAFKDGQFAMLFFLTVPFGGMLGVVAGITMVLLRVGSPSVAGWVCLVGGGLIAVMVALLTLFWSLSEAGEKGNGLVGFLTGLVHPAIGAPFVWAMVLVLWGLQLLRRS
jgi:hypothetical protein